MQTELVLGACTKLVVLTVLAAGRALAADPIVTAIPGPATPIGLSECIEEALSSNAGLQAERQRRGELSGQKKQALSTGLPSIDLTGSWNRGRDPSFAFNESFSGGDTEGVTGTELDSLFAGLSFIPDAQDIPAQTFWRTSLNARWELRPGLVYNAIGAAGVGITRQEVLIADQEDRTIEKVLTTYYDVLRASEQLAALEADLMAKQEFRAVTRRRFFLGLSTPLDTLRATVTYANLIPQRRSTVQNLRDAASKLNVSMGRPPLTPLAIEGDIRVEREPIDADAAIARVEHRPDIRQLDLLEKILRKNRGAQKAQHRPYFSADASYGYVTSEFDQLTDEGHDFWSAGVILTVPLFDGLLTKGQVEETEATIRRTHLELEEAKRGARLETLSLLGELEAAHENLAAAKMNLAAAEDALSQTELRYELGKTDYLSVLSSQADRLLARTNRIDARNRVLTLTASLKRALGFSPSMPLAEVAQALTADRLKPGGTTP